MAFILLNMLKLKRIAIRIQAMNTTLLGRYRAFLHMHTLPLMKFLKEEPQATVV